MGEIFYNLSDVSVDRKKFNLLLNILTENEHFLFYLIHVNKILVFRGKGDKSTK